MKFFKKNKSFMQEPHPLGHLAAIIESSDDAIISKNLHSVIMSWNKGAERIFGYTAKEAIGKSVLMLIPEGRHNEEPEILRKLQRRERIDHYQTIRQRKDGTLVNISLTVSPILDEKGNVVGASKIARDITEQKKIEETLAKTNQQLKEAAANLERRVEERTEQLRTLAVELIDAEEKERKRLAQILHDHLQQVLVAAKMKLELIQRKQHHLFDQTAFGELRRFIDEAFDTSRSLTAELRPPVLYESGLIPALRFLARKFYDQYQFDIEIAADADAEPASTFLKTMIYSTIQEIIFNAVKYSGTKKCRMQIKRLTNSDIQVIIEDQGVGFDAEKIGKKGSQGFGLFSIRERMKAFGGEFKIESSTGNGSLFQINIPDIPEQESAEVAKETGKKDGKISKAKREGINVLLVDDHKILRQSLASLLANQPFIGEINEAEDGRDAVEKTESLRPDVILMDLNMPRLNGLEATRIIHQKHPHIKILGLSVQTEPETVQSMKESGAVGHFSKGEETEVLIETIRHLAEDRETLISRP